MPLIIFVPNWNRWLDLSKNVLSGTVPSGLTVLTKLRYDRLHLTREDGLTDPVFTWRALAIFS